MGEKRITSIFVHEAFRVMGNDTVNDIVNGTVNDTVYKTLPVTLDFAKVLARMSKQNEAIFDKAYDFRFFM